MSEAVKGLQPKTLLSGILVRANFFFLKDLETFCLWIIVEGSLHSLCESFGVSRVKGDHVPPKKRGGQTGEKPGFRVLPVET